MDILGNASDHEPGFDAPADIEPEMPPRPSRRRLATAGFAGFALGCVVLGVLWAVSGSHVGASDDAKAACAAFARVGQLPDTSGSRTGIGDLALTQDRLHRMNAARELADAAATDDVAYSSLSRAMDEVANMVVSVRFDDPEGHRALAQVQEICTRL